MKQAKQRVIAIDYFRGLCILVVLLTHSALFSKPFAYITGVGQLWTSAAEIFFLLSGITFGIVRGPKIASDFKAITLKTWRRAGIIYLINLALITYALLIGYFLLSKGVSPYLGDGLPDSSSSSLFFSLITLHSPIGWADFLMYYAVLLMVAPFIARAVRSKFWPVITLASLFVFLIKLTGAQYSNFSVWQFYFVIGIVLARFRPQIIGWLYGLSANTQKIIYRTTMALASVTILLGILLNFNLFPTVDKLAYTGWIPYKVRGAYSHLLQHKYTIDFWFGNSRTGPLRPLVALLILLAAYLLYQKHKEYILSRTGRVINKAGSDTLWIYSAQAITLPLIAALPLHYGNIAIDSITTAFFLYCMWLVTRRHELKYALVNYFKELKVSYSQAKYSYLSQVKD